MRPADGPGAGSERELARTQRRLDPAPVVGGLVLALVVASLAEDGGFAPTAWQLGTLVLVGLLVVTVVAIGPELRRLAGWRAVAVGTFAGYVAWSYLSILWASQPGTALDGSNRTFCYFVAFLLMAILPWTVAGLRRLLVGFVLVCGVAAVVVLVHVASLEDPSDAFGLARLAAPLGYQNASAALWAMVGLAGLVLAARAETPALARAALIGFAPIFGGMGLMAQSRGWLVGLVAGAVVAFALVPTRLRLLVALAVPAVAVLVISPTLLDVYEAGSADLFDRTRDAAAVQAIAAALDPAVAAMIRAGLACLIAGAGLVALDRWLGRSLALPVPSRGVRALVAGAAVVVVVAGAFVATSGRPVAEARSVYSSLSSLEEVGGRGGSRFTSLGSSRFDMWRVGLHEWRRQPIGGAGQDNFAEAYLREGRSFEQPLWVHSLPLRLLAHTGIVGLLLFGALLVAIAASAWRWARTTGEVGAVVVTAACVPLVIWVVQGSQDWFWEMPALSVVALGLGGAAMGIPSRTRSTRRSRSTTALVVAVVAVTVVAILPSWFADRLIERATAVQAAAPAAALRDLDRAATWNPFTSRADVLAGVIALRSGRREEAIGRFGNALQREEGLWFAHLERGLLLAERGDRRMARAELARARTLAPRNEIVRGAERDLVAGRPPTVEQVNAALQEESRSVVAR